MKEELVQTNLSLELARSILEFQKTPEGVEAVKKVFPESFTHIANLNVAAIGFGLKVAGIDWRSQHDYAVFMGLAAEAGIIEHENGNPYILRRGTTAVKPILLDIINQ